MSEEQTDPRLRLELRSEQLRARLDPALLRFETTADIEPLVGTVGQPRALRAIEFGLAMQTRGFNVFVSGAPGSARWGTVRDYVDRFAASQPTPDDWVYVHNFASFDRPNAIRLPAGGAAAFARAMHELVTAARRETSRAFESEEYDRRQRELSGEISGRRESMAKELAGFAHERGFAVAITVTGVVTTPLMEGHPLTTEQFERLPPEQQQEIERRNAEVAERTGAYVRQLHQLEKEAAERLGELEREVALFAIGPLFHDLRERYADHEEVLAHLADVERDVLGHLADFREGEGEDESVALPALLALGRRRDFARYQVNVLVDNGATPGAPVVIERNPSYYNLAGRVEYRASMGSMVTDFREIKAGALHRANGGYLVLEAIDVLRHPFAWDALKRALSGENIRIENLGEEFSAVPSASLRPEPIPLNLKVVLVGAPLLYRLLYAFDDDFRELFKVKADFAPDMDWGDEGFSGYARFVSRWVRDAGLRHLDRSAVACLIEYGARLREDQRKLSTRLSEVSDVVSEAGFCAAQAGRDIATAEDVRRAISEREYRSNLLEERVREWIANGTIVIDTDRAREGQVNGISVVELGDYAFGKPVRVTARVALGRGGVRSIEREIELSGPIHSKGFLTVVGYLAGKYAQDLPLALNATITFEQSYDEVEGDSAASTELYCLLSALAGVPLAQGIAVTGSVNQNGEVQAVGGVTRKVEGFYAVCKANGLTGDQGVIVPAANRANLMLAEEVVDAVRGGRFHIWAVRTIDEGIEILTGLPAGELLADGSYPQGTVHALVRARLAEYAERLRAFSAEHAESPERRALELADALETPTARHASEG